MTKKSRCARQGYSRHSVLVSDGNVCRIENQAVAGLAANAGGTVRVTGEGGADGSSIRVAKLESVTKK